MKIAITLAAALLVGAGFVLQQRAAEQVPKSYFLVFGDVVHLSPGMLALQAAGIAALVAGVILVARAPALSRLGRPAILLQPRTDR